MKSRLKNWTKSGLPSHLSSYWIWVRGHTLFNNGRILCASFPSFYRVLFWSNSHCCFAVVFSWSTFIFVHSFQIVCVFWRRRSSAHLIHIDLIRRLLHKTGADERGRGWSPRGLHAPVPNTVGQSTATPVRRDPRCPKHWTVGCMLTLVFWTREKCRSKWLNLG